MAPVSQRQTMPVNNKIKREKRRFAYEMVEIGDEIRGVASRPWELERNEITTMITPSAC